MRRTKRVIVVLDVAGYAKAFQTHSDEKLVAFVQDYYAACERVLSVRGGAVIKFIGDACLAVFPADKAKNAVEAVTSVHNLVTVLARAHKLELALGANLHLAEAIEGKFGAGANKRRDILGRGVNQTFLLGRGAGIRISESIYRALPSSARAAWKKLKPPAVYHLNAPDGIYEGLGKDAVSNASRW